MRLIKKLFYKIFKKNGHGFRPDYDLSIALSGDFMLDKRIGPYLNTFGPNYPFEKLMPVLDGYDVRALNLETPLSNAHGEKHPGKQFNFQAPVYVTAMLRRAGIDYVSLANNHILDFGEKVAKDTVYNLKKYGIKHSGIPFAKNPAIVELGGKKIAFLSFIDSETLPAGFEKHVSVWGPRSKAEIKRARVRADIVIVAMHWGIEMMRTANMRQRKIARDIINAGADIVWGHHPHVIQETEKYKNGVIFYSLGNFIFSHLTPNIRRGLIAGIHIKNGKVAAVTEHIINNDNYWVRFRPYVIKTTTYVLPNDK